MGTRGDSGLGIFRRVVAGALATLCAVAGMVVALPVSPAAASHCSIAPVLRDMTVNQGVGSYAMLTRGKDTLVRGYLSLPQVLPTCAGTGAYTEVTGGSLTVTGGTTTTVTPTPAPVSPYARVASYTSATALDGTADLKFVIPGTAFDNSDVTAAYNASFSLTINYRSKGSTKDALSQIAPVTFTTKTAMVGLPSNNLPVLVVPVGNKSDTSGFQFPSEATTAVQNGMAAVSRVAPVRSGVSDLTVGGNGLRYTLLPTSSMLDVGPAGLNLMPGNQLCIEPLKVWPAVSGKLATYLADWNSANPSSPADRAIGVISKNVSAGAELNCYEGIADVNGRQAMVRVYSDVTSTSFTGALAAHELLHTFGGSHSLNLTADKDAPNRAYNVATRQFLASAVNRSLMNTTFDSNYTNNNTLFESGAYSLAQCALTPGASCTNPGTVGVAGAGGPALVLSGTTCGNSAACTNVISFLDGSNPPRTNPDPSSPYSLVQLNGATPLVDGTTPVRVCGTNHDDSVGGSTPTSSCNVSISVTLAAGANRVELRKGSTVLYSAAYDGIDPSFTSTLSTLTTATLTNFTNAAGDDKQPALCSNGSLLAWVDGSGIRVRRVDKSEDASASGALPGAEPAWSRDCSKLVYTTTGAVLPGRIQTVSVNAGSGAPTFGTPTTIYSSALLGLVGSAPANHPSFTPDGESVVAGINDDIFRIDPGSVLPPDEITCTTPLLSPLAIGCVGIVTTGAVERNPSVSATGEVAYDSVSGSFSSVRKSDLDGGNQRDFIGNATLATFGGPVEGTQQPALLARSREVLAKDIDGTETQLTSETDTGTDTWPALDAAGRTFAIHRDTAGASDIWVGTRSGITARVYDNNIANVTLAVFVDCGGTHIPVQDPVAPSSVQPSTGTSGTATYLVPLDPSTVCAGGKIKLRASDGWLTTTVTDDSPAGSPHFPTPSISSLPQGIRLLQFDSWAFSGSATDADESSAALTLSWSISGPGGYTNNTLTGPSPSDVQPPTGGFTPGQYMVTLTASDSTGRTASTQHQWTVDPDADHDGIPASRDKTCGGANADTDPSNADIDCDGDGLYNRDDPDPFTAPNATISITPTVINVNNDTGNPINMSITTSALDLRTIDRATVRLTMIGGIPMSPALVAYNWTAAATSASATFDRPTVDRFLRDSNLIGSKISFTVTGSNGTAVFLGSGTAATCSGNRCPMT